MTILMTHPNHGQMHAYDTGEVERLQKLGWSVAAPKKVEEVPQEIARDTTPADIATYKKKLGRPFKAK